MENNENKKQKSHPVLYVIILILAIVIAVLAFMFGKKYKLDKNDSHTIVADDANQQVFSDLDDDDYTVNDFDDNLLRKIDFEKLHETNSDIVSWVYIPDLVDTAVVQASSTNPDYYKTHNVYNEASSNGCVYMTAENSEGLTDARQIIQGYGLNNIESYLDKKYAAKTSATEWNDVVYVYTEDYATSYHVYSCISENSSSLTYSDLMSPCSDDYTKLWEYWIKNAPYTGCNTLSEYDNTENVLILSAFPEGSDSSKRYTLICIPYRVFDYKTNCEIDENGTITNVYTEDERWNANGWLNQDVSDSETTVSEGEIGDDNTMTQIETSATEESTDTTEDNVTTETVDNTQTEETVN